MTVAVTMTIATNREEPLRALSARTHAAFHAAGLGEPSIRFILVDDSRSTEPGYVSAVARTIKKFPSLKQFLSHTRRHGGSETVRQIAYPLKLVADADPQMFVTLCNIVAGLPLSLPFQQVRINLYADAFGPEGEHVHDDFTTPDTGITISDDRWVTDRQRKVIARVVVPGASAETVSPTLSPPIRAVLAACGTVRGEQLSRFPP